jgi:hypothetical protein
MITESFHYCCRREDAVKKTICYEMTILIVLSLFCRSSDLRAAELRPFVLPGNRPPASQMEQRPVRQRSPSETPSVYRQFENDISKMSVQDRQKLTKYYRGLRSQAYREGNRTKINYYDNLLSILDRYQ